MILVLHNKNTIFRFVRENSGNARFTHTKTTTRNNKHKNELNVSKAISLLIQTDVRLHRTKRL